jgi:hypothetical protein
MQPPHRDLLPPLPVLYAPLGHSFGEIFRIPRYGIALLGPCQLDALQYSHSLTVSSCLHRPIFVWRISRKVCRDCMHNPPLCAPFHSNSSFPDSGEVGTVRIRLIWDSATFSPYFSLSLGIHVPSFSKCAVIARVACLLVHFGTLLKRGQHRGCVVLGTVWRYSLRVME